MKSFAAKVRDALARMDAPAKPCCRLAEWTGFALSCGTVSLLSGGAFRLTVQSDHPGTVRRMTQMLRQDFRITPEMRIKQISQLGGRRSYEIRLNGEDAQMVLATLELEPPRRNIPKHCRARKCCRAAFLRGVFLGCGTIIDPARGYLLEFVLRDPGDARALAGFLAADGMGAGVTERKGAHVVYMKDGDAIMHALSMLGAHGAILELENIRILRDARNRANRAANCDQANITKMLDASDRQLAAIARIEGAIGLSSLPQVLHEIALERKRYPDASLEELGAALDPPVGKSGVYHRLRRIEALAATLTEPDQTNTTRRGEEG